MLASQIAIRNHRKEKLDMLQAGLLNIAGNNNLEEDISTMFISYIDILTVWHIRILVFLSNPREWFEKNNIIKPNIHMGSTTHLLEAAMPELKDDKERYNQMIKDLYNRNLVRNDSISGMMTADAMYQSRTTTTGNQFLDFITSPINDIES